MPPNTFLERVGNSIDLEAGVNAYDTWIKLSAANVIQDELSKVSAAAAATPSEKLPPKSTSSESPQVVTKEAEPNVEPASPDNEDVRPNEKSLIPYPVHWHTAQPMIYEDPIPRQTLWNQYRHCRCGGATRYYGRGYPFNRFWPAGMHFRPPCCFTQVQISCETNGLVRVRDEHNNYLLRQQVKLGTTLNPDSERRRIEESIMWVLCQNIWWIANENCTKIDLSLTEDKKVQTNFCSSPYASTLILPFFEDKRVSLRSFVSKLAEIYTHVEFVLPEQ